MLSHSWKFLFSPMKIVTFSAVTGVVILAIDVPMLSFLPFSLSTIAYLLCYCVFLLLPLITSYFFYQIMFLRELHISSQLLVCFKYLKIAVSVYFLRVVKF